MKQQRPSCVRFGVLVFLALAASSAYLTRHCIAVANTTIQADLGLDDKKMGWVLAAFSIGYFVCQIPGGWLAGRIGTRSAFSLISTLWSLLTIWTALAWSFVPLLASRVAFGLAQAGLVPISARVVKDWFPLQRRGLSSAVIGASMSLGAVITMGLTGVLIEHLHWREVFAVYSLVGIVWAIAFFAYFRTHPGDHAWVNRAELALIRGGTEDQAEAAEPPPLSTARLWSRMLRSRTVWAINVQSFFRAAGYGLFVTWFPALLEYRFEMSEGAAGRINMVPLACVIVGTMFGGLFVDTLLRRSGSRWLSRSGVAVVALGLTAALTFASTFVSSAALFIGLMSAAAFCAGGGNPAAWAATMDVAGRYTAVVMGAMNMAGTVGAFAMPVALGYLIGNIRETRGDWNQVIYFVAGIYLAGALSWLAVDPNRSPADS